MQKGMTSWGGMTFSFDFGSRKHDIRWSTNQEESLVLCLEWGLGQSHSERRRGEWDLPRQMVGFEFRNLTARNNERGFSLVSRARGKSIVLDEVEGG